MGAFSCCQAFSALVIAVAFTCYTMRPRYDAARLKLEEHFILATALNSSRLVWHQQQVALQPPLDGLFINTVVVSRAPGAFPKQAPGQRRTLVMIHGWCGAVGYWVRNFEGLLDTYHDIYAIDLLGWGRSSRPLVHDVQTAEQAQKFWVSSVEQWRQAIGLEEPFDLLGHSLGTYVSASYAATHPTFVRRLVLAAPIGIEPNTHPAGNSLLAQVIYRLQWAMGLTIPMIIRALGPFGPSLVWKATGGDDIADDDVTPWLSAFCGHAHREHVFEYTMQLLLAPSSGDSVTERLKNPASGYLRPIFRHGIHDLTMPVTLIYGENDHVAVNTMQNEVLAALPNSESRVIFMPGVTHQLYMERPDAFNKFVVT